MESGGGPSAIYDGGYKEDAIGEGVVGGVRVFGKEKTFFKF